MPDFISIDASELEAFGQQIGAAVDLIRDVSHRLTDNIARDTVAFAQTYPASPRDFKASRFWTDKQRRFFFSALARGEIQVPYRRTQHLKMSWRFRSLPGADVFTAEVYNDADYRQWVQGFARQQARIHRGRWQSQEEIEQAAAGYAVKRVAEASSELERLFLTRLGK